MHYNVTFSQAPSPETDAAWSSLFPKGVGFVRHPVISLKLSGIAVFHELHCLVYTPFPPPHPSPPP